MKRVCIAIAIFCCACAAAWSGGVKWWFVPKRWEAVEPGVLYRSAAIDPRLLKPMWEKNGIKTVVVMGHDKPGNRQHESERRVASELGIERVLFPLDGKGMGKSSSYVSALALILHAEREKKPVLVHCAEGVYRTGGVIALYRVLIQGWTGPDAYQEMVDRGVKTDSPLIPYLNEHLLEIATALVEQGETDHIPDPLPVIGPAS